MICQSSLESAVFFFLFFSSKINCGRIGVFWKILLQFQNTFFLYNLVGYLKGYLHKLLLQFGTVQLTGKLPYFDNQKFMYLLMTKFLGYFYYSCQFLFWWFCCNYSWLWHCFYWRSCGVDGFEENAYQVDLKNICWFLWIQFYRKGD